MIGAFYTLKQDYYTRTDDVWEGAFSLLASVIISIMGAALLRVSKLQDKWRVKLAQALQAKPKPGDGAMAFLKQWAEKYAMFLLPFVTVLREGLEAVVFIGGVSLSSPASGFPLAVFCGLLAGIAVGYLMYRYTSSPGSEIGVFTDIVVNIVVEIVRHSRSSSSYRPAFCTWCQLAFSQKPLASSKPKPGTTSLEATSRKQVQALDHTIFVKVCGMSTAATP